MGGKNLQPTRWDDENPVFCTLENNMSNEKKALGWLGYIGDEISYPVIWALFHKP